MRRQMMLAALALAVVVPLWAGEDETLDPMGPGDRKTAVDERRPAAADGRVEIENLTGSIKVLGWDREEVAVTGTLGVGAESVQLTGGARRTRVEVESSLDPHAARADLEIHVPAASRLEIESFSADISVSGVTGELRAESVNGSISAVGSLKEVSLDTVSGGIELTGAVPRVKVESVNGPITLKDVRGEVDASSVNGKLVVLGGLFARARLETVSGGLRFEGELAAKGALEVESVSGSVELRLPGSLAADFVVSSFSGTIDNELGPPARKVGRYTPERELEFQTGSGGARVEVKTMSGAIALRKR